MADEPSSEDDSGSPSRLEDGYFDKESMATRVRRLLEPAVMLREYKRVKLNAASSRIVSLDHVIETRGEEITHFERFYNDRCLRVFFGEDENSYVDAYYSLELANIAAQGTS